MNKLYSILNESYFPALLFSSEISKCTDKIEDLFLFFATDNRNVLSLKQLRLSIFLCLLNI
ncbi:hypothetical protein T07_9888 [Trichinella nelsoni]|uniref:Uncharacterized protein n=1 Tax=Trichinella nelsoni TaxID=6336 RepID=A0A0V0RJF5_9BILA|nr:hypothetical protein T07_9888 [Trichinella nelsoni]